MANHQKPDFTRRMLINTRQSEEIRVAIIEGKKLLHLDIQPQHIHQKKDNIYLGKISRIVPSLNACFVDYGSEKNGFLPLKEISPEYWLTKPADPNKPEINKLLKEGQEVLVQINKEERGNKGAAISTYITLAGCYLVLMPNNPDSGGISRQISGEERQQMRDYLSQLTVPEGMSIIVRTAGLGRSIEELQWDQQTLMTLWEAIRNAVLSEQAPSLIYQESDIIFRNIRDHLREEIDEIQVDTDDSYNTVLRHIKRIRPDYVKRLHFYGKDRPLFSQYQIESQIESAYDREVRLPSGGSIVIDYTEALTAIDINSAKATGGSDIEETALQTNLEAADEIARQARIRDLGGLLVIDFIDMSSNKNQRAVEQRLEQAIKHDRARIQLARISRFGLLEMSRQRLRPSISEFSHIVCPRCDGLGSIRGVESLSASLLRLISEQVNKNDTEEIHVQLPLSVTTYMLNEKRHALQALEKQSGTRILLIPNTNLETPHYKIERISKDGATTGKTSHTLREKNRVDENLVLPLKQAHKLESPAVKDLEVAQAPEKQKPGFFARIWNDLFGTSGSTNDESIQQKPKQTRKGHPKRRSNNKNNDQRRRNNTQRDGNKNNRHQDKKTNNQKTNKQNEQAIEAKQDNKGPKERKDNRSRKSPQNKQQNRAPRNNKPKTKAPTPQTPPPVETPPVVLKKISDEVREILQSMDDANNTATWVSTTIEMAPLPEWINRDESVTDTTLDASFADRAKSMITVEGAQCVSSLNEGNIHTHITREVETV